MNIVYSDKAKQSREFPLLQQASQRLADIIGPGARFVTVEWDRSVEADGQPLYTLRLKDPRGEASTTFDLWQLQSSFDVGHRLRSVWDDVLRAEMHRLLRERETAVTGE